MSETPINAEKSNSTPKGQLPTTPSEGAVPSRQSRLGVGRTQTRNLDDLVCAFISLPRPLHALKVF